MTGTTAAATAQSTTQSPAAARYAQCLGLARTDPARAFDMAGNWRGVGGGAPARHCEAVALINLGNPRDGAVRLEALAQEMRTTKAFKAQLLAQSGQAWLLAGDPKAARALFDAAIDLALGDPAAPTLIPDLLVDRAQALAAMGAYKDAIGDLNQVLEHRPDHLAALVFRGTAHRFTNALPLAAIDVDRALTLAPDLPEALLERGILHRLGGQNDLARRAWQRLLEVAPQGPSAVAARANLQRLDMNIE